VGADGRRRHRARRPRWHRCRRGRAPPQLGSAVTGETTGDDEPATDEGIDLEAGDNADAMAQGGPDIPEDAEPDLKDVAAAQRERDQ
jgi:hypothetical protein